MLSRRQRLKILHVVPTYLPAVRYGGPIYTVHGLCRALVERGHDVHVHTTNVDGPGVSDVPTDRAVEVEGVAVHYFATGFGRRLYRSPTMCRALKMTGASFDIIHLHSVFLWPTMAAGRIARQRRIPYIVTPRGMLVADLIARKSRTVKRAWINLFERRNIEHAAAVHFTSQIEADAMRSMGLESRMSAIIPNGLDAADVPAMPSADDLAWVGKLPQPFVLYLGRINWKKGLDRLIAAMARVERMDLVVAGYDDDQYRETLLSLADRQGITHRIQFIGAVTGTRKWALLRQARMLVLPSYSENFGMVVLEAMAVGCPVVVTTEVGLAPVVKASGAGLVVTGDPGELATAIALIDEHEDARTKMGDAGRRTATDQFSWATVAVEMETLYKSCIDQADLPAFSVTS